MPLLENANNCGDPHFSDRPVVLKWLILPYLLLIIIHLVYAVNIQQPWYFADESGYLGNARYLSGNSHMRMTGSYYHPGYSMLILPAFICFSEPVSIYKAVLVINCILICSLFFPLFFLLKRLFSASNKITTITAFTVCLYPAFSLQANLALAENAFIPCYALLVVSFFLFFSEKTYPYALLFGLLAGFIYTIHPRGLAVAAISICCICFLAAVKALPARKVFAAVIITCFVLAFTFLLNKHLKTLAWSGVASGFENPAGVATYLFKKFLGIKDILMEVAGQFLYLIQATYGLFLLGLINIVAIIRKEISPLSSTKKTFQDIRSMTLLFVVITSIGIFLTSVMLLAGPHNNMALGDLLIYGRYNEGFLAIYMASGLIWLYSRSQETIRKFETLTFFVIIILTFFFIVGIGYNKLMSYTWINGVNAFGIWPFFSEFRRLDICLISLFAIIMFITIIRLIKIKFIWGIAMLIFLFSTFTFYGFHSIFMPSQKERIEQTTLVSYIKQFDVIGYDRAFHDLRSFFSYQYLAPHVRFRTFSRKKRKLPEVDAVISGRKWKDAKRLNARLVAVENKKDQVLWGLPEK